MRRLIRYVYKSLLATNHVCKHSTNIFEYIPKIHYLFKHLKMEAVDGLKERNVLVLSPHQDDDIIGCGGTMYLYHLKGAHVTSVYMTDGRKGNTRYREEDLVEVRKEEARRAAAVVGIKRLIFLDNRDMELFSESKTISTLADILRDVKPDAVFLPFLLDTHVDHIATNKILLGAMKSSPAFMCYAYGVWTPLPTFNFSVDITPYIDVKRRALEEYRSQLEMFDLVGASLGLSKYYSALWKGKGWTEVYIACPSDGYTKLMETIGW